MNQDHSTHNVLALEPLQARELAPLLRDAYVTGGAVFGELIRDQSQTGAPILILAVLDRKKARKIRKILNEAKLSDKAE